jgi:hypothetical protein
MLARYIVIGQDGRPHGPMTVEALAAWLGDGYATRHSRARREDDSNWRALQDFEELRGILRPPAPPDPSPPGATGAGDGDARRTINIISSFTRSWALVRRHFIELAGWSLSMGLLVYLVAQVPRVGWFIGLVFNSVLAGALSVLYLARIRGRRVEFKEVSAAVWAAAVNLCLVGMIQTLLTLAGAVVLNALERGQVGLTQTLLAAAGVILIAPGLYLAVAYVFALTLAIDKRLHFWAALELSRRAITRQWWPMFGLVLAAVALVTGGILTYGVGLVLAVPLATAALLYAYEDVFGE